MFDGFPMPSQAQDSETAAMYKRLLLRPSALAHSDTLTEEMAELQAFAPMCSPLPDGSQEYFTPAT
eukprot:5988500-Pyramimonas_sp.AAC.1